VFLLWWKYTTCLSYFQAVKPKYVLCTMYYPTLLQMHNWFGEFVISEVSKQRHWVIWGFRRNVNEILPVLGFYAPKISSSETTVRSNIPVLSSRLKVFLNRLTLKQIQWVWFQRAQITNCKIPLTKINYSHCESSDFSDLNIA